MEPTAVAETGDTIDPILDELVPVEPTPLRRLAMAATIVGLVSLASWAWGAGWIIPQPFGIQDEDFQGATTLAADVDSDLVILAWIYIPNYSQRDLVVTDVRVEGIPAEVVDVRWAFEQERRSNQIRPSFVVGLHPLPAEVPPTDYERGESSQLDVYLRPDCDAVWPEPDQPAGSVSMRFEYPNRPPWLHNWVTGRDPIWAPDTDPSDEGYQSTGMIRDQALDADDNSIPITTLKATMCQLAGVDQ